MGYVDLVVVAYWVVIALLAIGALSAAAVGVMLALWPKKSVGPWR